VYALLTTRVPVAKTLGSSLDWFVCHSLLGTDSLSSIERFELGCVKMTMNRARVILALLLPGLWLAVSASSVPGVIKGCAGNPLAALISDRGHAKHDASNDVCSLEQSARRCGRRITAQPGSAGTPTFLVSSQFQLPQLEHAESFSVGSRTSLSLAQCWQFRWRTALEPRAPSSVS
jgi:hypothetical protein